ncbi:YceI family protein [Pelomonas sp. KK5]|uniref:YceI family protein n=1 Tax=Pelomonas sp. KK5 TaxID=1855730 RepID=UPI001301E9CC|nr:YceI family protein [Pelomonas sp. KK5]
MLLASCAQVPEPAAVDAAADWRLPEAGRRAYRLDAAASKVRILVFRGGAAARLGHNHVLTLPGLSGTLVLPEPGPLADARFLLAFDLAGMVLDEPAERAALGPAWASVPSADAIEGTRTNMLGEAGLQAARFPQVRLRALRITGEAPRLAAEVEIELHGRRRSQWVPLNVDVSDARIKVAGSLVLRQSDYGLAPFSVLGGLLSVRDELVVDFDLSLIR